MQTYNFIVMIGKNQFGLDVNAYTEDEAIDIIQKEYPIEQGYRYILL
jgi:hypothetical protein